MCYCFCEYILIIYWSWYPLQQDNWRTYHTTENTNVLNWQDKILDMSRIIWVYLLRMRLKELSLLLKDIILKEHMNMVQWHLRVTLAASTAAKLTIIEEFSRWRRLKTRMGRDSLEFIGAWIVGGSIAIAADTADRNLMRWTLVLALLHDSLAHYSQNLHLTSRAWA